MKKEREEDIEMNLTGSNESTQPVEPAKSRWFTRKSRNIQTSTADKRKPQRGSGINVRSAVISVQPTN